METTAHGWKIFDDLSRYGPVRAFVASNASRYLGIREGKARQAPPDWLIATHGDIVDFKRNPDVGRTLFAAT